MRFSAHHFAKVAAGSLSAALLAGTAHAGIVVSNLNEPSNGTGTIYAAGPPQWYAQAFVTGAQSVELGTVIAPLGDSSGSYSAFAELISDDGGSPGATVIAEFTVPSIGTSIADLTFDPTSNVELAANTEYWFVLGATGSDPTAEDKWSYTYTSSADFPAYAYSHNSGTTWTVETNGPFRLQVNSVPEASTWALMLLGFAGLAFPGYRGALKRATSAA